MIEAGDLLGLSAAESPIGRGAAPGDGQLRPGLLAIGR
jgi:hypothetical protein